MAIKDEGSEWASDLVRRVGLEAKRLRGKQSARWLSDKTAELGYRVSPTVIAKLDGGYRGSVLNLHEVLVLAAALEVSPIELIYPPNAADKIEVLPGKSQANYVAAQEFSASEYYSAVGELAEELRRFHGQMSLVLKYEQGEVETASPDLSPARLAVLAARSARRTGQRVEALYDKLDRSVWPGVMPYEAFRMAMDIVDDAQATFPIEGGSDG